MPDSRLAEQLWSDYLGTLPEAHPHSLHPVPSTWKFGYDEVLVDQLADQLVELVMKGLKTATCGRYQGENVLVEGGLSIILDGDDVPQCLVDTYEITIRRYDEVDARFASEEGEGDLSLDYWREAHWRFFQQEAQAKGLEVGEDMLLACERFHVLYKNPNSKFAAPQG